MGKFNGILALSGIQWTISASATVPSSPGTMGSVVIVSDPVLDVSAIKRVGIYSSLDTTNGNIYEANTVNIFGALNDVSGTEATLIDNSSVIIGGYVSNSVVNQGGSQFVCDVYVWDISKKRWVMAAYQKLNPAIKEYVDLANWCTPDIDVSNLEVWTNLNAYDSSVTYVNTNIYEIIETADISKWASVVVDLSTLSVWSNLNVTDSGTVTVNDTPQPF